MHTCCTRIVTGLVLATHKQNVFLMIINFFLSNYPWQTIKSVSHDDCVCVTDELSLALMIIHTSSDHSTVQEFSHICLDLVFGVHNHKSFPMNNSKVASSNYDSNYEVLIMIIIAYNLSFHYHFQSECIY